MSFACILISFLGLAVRTSAGQQSNLEKYRNGVEGRKPMPNGGWAVGARRPLLGMHDAALFRRQGSTFDKRRTDKVSF